MNDEAHLTLVSVVMVVAKGICVSFYNSNDSVFFLCPV